MFFNSEGDPVLHLPIRRSRLKLCIWLPPLL